MFLWKVKLNKWERGKTFEALLCKSNVCYLTSPPPQCQAQVMSKYHHQSHRESVGAMEIAAVSNSYFDMTDTQLLKQSADNTHSSWVL